MKIQISLSETDIQDAIACWLRSKSMEPVGRATLTHTAGDRPWEGETFGASDEATTASKSHGVEADCG
jgi:hypothetical protein